MDTRTLSQPESAADFNTICDLARHGDREALLATSIGLDINHGFLTPIAVLAKEQNYPAVNLLIELGANPNNALVYLDYDHSCRIPESVIRKTIAMQRAGYWGNVKEVKRLAKEGISLDYALMGAAEAGRFQPTSNAEGLSVPELMEQGIDNTYVLAGCVYGGYLSEMKSLLADLVAKAKGGEGCTIISTALYYVALSGNCTLVDELAEEYRTYNDARDFFNKYIYEAMFRGGWFELAKNYLKFEDKYNWYQITGYCRGGHSSHVEAMFNSKKIKMKNLNTAFRGYILAGNFKKAQQLLLNESIDLHKAMAQLAQDGAETMVNDLLKREPELVVDAIKGYDVCQHAAQAKYLALKFLTSNKKMHKRVRRFTKNNPKLSLDISEMLPIAIKLKGLMKEYQLNFNQPIKFFQKITALIDEHQFSERQALAWITKPYLRTWLMESIKNSVMSEEGSEINLDEDNCDVVATFVSGLSFDEVNGLKRKGFAHTYSMFARTELENFLERQDQVITERINAETGEKFALSRTPFGFFPKKEITDTATREQIRDANRLLMSLQAVKTSSELAGLLETVDKNTLKALNLDKHLQRLSA